MSYGIVIIPAICRADPRLRNMCITGDANGNKWNYFSNYYYHRFKEWVLCEIFKRFCTSLCSCMPWIMVCVNLHKNRKTISTLLLIVLAVIGVSRP